MKIYLFVIAVASSAACNTDVAGPDPTATLRVAKERAARAQIAIMASALEAAKVMGGGEYPASLTGALEQPEPDPWGSAWIYARPGKAGKPYDLYSAGPDKTPNTADDVR
jgi:hypothetical protein